MFVGGPRRPQDPISTDNAETRRSLTCQLLGRRGCVLQCQFLSANKSDVMLDGLHDLRGQVAGERIRCPNPFPRDPCCGANWLPRSLSTYATRLSLDRDPPVARSPLICPRGGSRVFQLRSRKGVSRHGSCLSALQPYPSNPLRPIQRDRCPSWFGFQAGFDSTRISVLKQPGTSSSLDQI